MGFLNWFKNTEENSQESQLDLLGNSQPVRSRVDGATVRKDFTRTIQNKGGNREAQAKSTEAMTNEIFGCSTDQLYQQTNARKSDRTSLPQDVQSAYVVGETAATHRLKNTDIGGNQSQRNQQIVDVVQDSSKQVKGIFPWNW